MKIFLRYQNSRVTVFRGQKRACANLQLVIFLSEAKKVSDHLVLLDDRHVPRGE